MGYFSTPLNLLASVALHLDGVVVLFQYLFGHRYNVDPCPHCEHPWHPNDSGDTFHRPYSARVGQWWRRSYIDSRSYITATVTPEPHVRGTTPEGAIKFSPDDLDEASDEMSVEQVRRLSSRSIQRPSMKQVELPDVVFDLPRLAIFVRDSRSSISRTSQSNNTQGSTPTERLSMSRQRPMSNFFSILGRPKRSLSILDPTVKSEKEPMVPVPFIHRSSLVGQVVYVDNPGDNRPGSVTSKNLGSSDVASQQQFRSAQQSSASQSSQSSRKSSRRKKSHATSAWSFQIPPPPGPPPTLSLPNPHDLNTPSTETSEKISLQSSTISAHSAEESTTVHINSNHIDTFPQTSRLLTPWKQSRKIVEVLKESSRSGHVSNGSHCERILSDSWLPMGRNIKDSAKPSVTSTEKSLGPQKDHKSSICFARKEGML
jgi:hypothetical protein